MSNQSVIGIFNEGRERILNAILSGESITKVMTDPSPICPLINKDILFGKKLGEGVFGEVFEVNFPGRGSRSYAVKKADSRAVYAREAEKKETFLYLERKYNIKAEKIINYNNLKGVKPEDVVGQNIWIPVFFQGCRIKKSKSYDRFDGRGQTKFIEGEHICPVPYGKSQSRKLRGYTGTSEFAISLLAGSLYRSGKSINFLDVFYFASCKDMVVGDNSIVNQYTFMETISSSLRKSLRCLCEIDYEGKKGLIYRSNPMAATTAINGVVIQILHAIHTMQAEYRIVHGDLHDDNIFLEFITKDTEYRGQKLIEIDYYEYKVGNRSIYIKGGRECPFIVKIGDWGMACKYSYPQIVNMDVMESGYDQYDGNGPWLPNFYTEMYDMYYIVDILYRLNPSNSFISDIMSWMLHVPPGMPDIIQSASIKDKTTRPAINKLDSSQFVGISPKNFLMDDAMMEEFYKVPPIGSKILLLGR